MEYKLYLQHKRIIPTATKRRWSDSQKGFRKHYKTWLQDPMHQDATSNCEEESSSHCNKPPHHSTDDTSESEEENSSQCNKPPHHFTDDTSESEEEEWDELNTTLHHNMQGESDNENEQNWHMTPPKDPTMDVEGHGNMDNNADENPRAVKDKIYPTARITKEESQLSILSYALRHTTTKSALGDLLDLINLHCPEGTNGAPNSLYMFMKEFDCNSFEIVYICPTCHHYFGNEIPANCASCGSEPGDKNSLIESGDMFMKLSIRKQLEEKILDSEFKTALDYKWTRVKSSPDSVQDIFDGAMYKSVDLLNDPGQFNLSLTWNVDGVPIFKSSPFHIWPIQVVINELPPDMRNKHVLLAGLWFGASKPEMNYFLQAFVDECIQLEQEGLLVQHRGQSTQMRVFNLVCVCDSVARCSVQNTKQFNGEYGCNWCYKKGEIVAKGNGFTRVYASQQRDARPRTHSQHFDDVKRAVETGTCVNGVKGPSPLMFLMYFNMILGFSFDYMHGILLGVSRQFTTLWFDSMYHGERWYLGRLVTTIDQRLFKIKPPVNITRPPRSVRLRKFWKASEYRNFLLFYSIPCLIGILPSDYLEHLLLLVQATYCLLKDDMSSHDIDVAEHLLKTFVSRFERLYGKCHVSFNVHILEHAAQSVRNWGPLWCQSAFIFESHNGTLQKLFHGTQAVPEQIVNSFSLFQSVPRLFSTVYNGSVKKTSTYFVERMLRGYKLATNCVKKNKHNISGLTYTKSTNTKGGVSVTRAKHSC
ncbi:uncharacterized protein [Misgurnus anguillicaudatus]|uniref:uncharacterized protein isoform X1 n=1 Tax=Misgurnus anguillicaudatus TaxID=75329 RepID=UPI003CCFBA2F